MNFILKWHERGRRRAVLGAEGNELLDRQAEMTLGLISRAGRSNGRSVLQEAMSATNVAKAAPMVRLLLDDYCEMVRALRSDPYSTQTFARYSLFEPVGEADVVELFTRFPRDAASFLQRLQLRPTHDLRSLGIEFVTCNASDRAFEDDMIVQSSTLMQPGERETTVIRRDGTVTRETMKWWEGIIEERFYGAGSNRSWCCFRSMKLSTETKTWLVPIVASKIQGDADSQVVSKLPFSALLKASCKYAENYRSAELFDSPVLAGIITHKWETACRAMFMTQFCVYAVYLVAFTFLVAVDHLAELSSCDQATGLCTINWWVWYLCCVFTAIQLKFELHSLRSSLRSPDSSAEEQGCGAGVRRYLGFWNVLDTVSVLLTTVALATMQIILTLKIPGDKQAAGTYLHVLSLENPPSGAEQEYALTSWPFERVATEGTPSVAVGDVGQRAVVGATKADVEKLMAQNVQLMQAMINQQRQLDQQQQTIAKLAVATQTSPAASDSAAGTAQPKPGREVHQSLTRSHGVGFAMELEAETEVEPEPEPEGTPRHRADFARTRSNAPPRTASSRKLG